MLPASSSSLQTAVKNRKKSMLDFYRQGVALNYKQHVLTVWMVFNIYISLGVLIPLGVLGSSTLEI